ncbi:hypothetical protein [Pseudobutyrivibrio sp.]
MKKFLIMMTVIMMVILTVSYGYYAEQKKYNYVNEKFKEYGYIIPVYYGEDVEFSIIGIDDYFNITYRRSNCKHVISYNIYCVEPGYQDTWFERTFRNHDDFMNQFIDDLETIFQYMDSMGWA